VCWKSQFRNWRRCSRSELRFKRPKGIGRTRASV
jgi:hypothetical protein